MKLLILAFVTCCLASSCSNCQYLYDGSSGPNARPYYKLCVDSDGKARVKCDSKTRLPSADCK